MNISGKEIKLFAGNSNTKLAEEIAARLNMPLGKATVKNFSDGETSVVIEEPVRGCDVFIIQSTSYPINDHLMELLIMVDALKRASAGRITAVIPYFGYARQDRKANPREPITAKLVANLLTSAGVDRILSMDLHTAQLEGFFDIPVDHLQGQCLLANYFKDKFYLGDPICGNDWVVVSPDVGSVGRTRKFAEMLNLPIAIIDKRRPKANESQVMNIIGDVIEKKVILVDDLIDTAGTIVHAAEALKGQGAFDIYACCTHPVLSGPALERIKNSPIEKLVVLNTIQFSKCPSKIKVLSVADKFAEAIARIYDNISMETI